MDARGEKSRRAYRVLALVGIPVVLLLTVEVILRLAGYGYCPSFFERHQIRDRAVWTENADFGRRFFPRGLVRSASPITIPSQKPPNTVRIFVMGESAAMGDPDLKFGLPRMLTVLLRERYPSRRIEVVNTAVVAINSHVILPIAKDCARLQGDLWVIYMGNNEIVGPFGSASVFGARAPALPLVRAGLWLKTTRLGQLLDAGLNLARQTSRGLPEWTGMEMMADQRIAHASPATRRVYRHFERNLGDILSTGVRTGVPVVLCTVATNIKDCAPFASLHRPEVSVAQVLEWQRAYEAGIAGEKAGNLTNALDLYAKAAQIDGDFADLAFRRAECSLQLGREREAASFFYQSRDQDALQFRADNQINGMIRAAAQQFMDRRVSLLDAEMLLATNSPQGLPGANYFYEHVHLTPEGNYLLARGVAEKAVKALGLPPGGEWVSQAECFRLVGLTEWNRYDALNTILDRIQSAPFTNQLDHANQLQMINEQIARHKLATKPAQVRRQADQVGALVNHDAEDADLRWNLASLLQSAGDYPGAEGQWRKLMELQPQSALPPFNLAKLLAGAGRQSEALPLYSQCLNLNPEYYAARYDMGALCLQMGRLPEAIGHLNLATRQKPGSVEAHLALGQALAQAGRRREAEKQWREVLRVEPDNSIARAGLREIGAGLSGE